MTMSNLGFGVGLRTAHYPAIRSGLADPSGPSALASIDWFEIISENYFEPGGNPRRMLRTVREHFPVVMHGVALSLGSTDPLDRGYLTRLRALAAEVEPALVSDHLCWSGVGGHTAHDLLPMPFTEEALTHVSARIVEVQDYLGRRILVENVSSYAQFSASTMEEAAFLSELATRADCEILLDVNNVFVSAHNHGFDAEAYIRALPQGRVAQFHLAGHSDDGELLIDTHDHPVRKEVWDLYALAVSTHGPAPTLLEWDDAIPELSVLARELEVARSVSRRALDAASASVTSRSA